MDKTKIEQELRALISSKLKEIRKKSGNTIEAMSEEIGIQYTNFWNVYSGANLPRLSTLAQISRTYNLPISYWFEDMDKISPKRQAEVQKKTKTVDMLTTYEKLDENTQEVILKILKSYVNKRKHSVK